LSSEFSKIRWKQARRARINDAVWIVHISGNLATARAAAAGRTAEIHGSNEIDISISSIQASKSEKRDFRHFSGAKVCYSNENVKFEDFMHVEWSEEKFSKGIVGDKTRLRF